MNRFINSVFSIGDSIGQIATGNENQKVAGVQNLIEQAMNLVNKLVNIQADANNKVKADKEKAEEVLEEATQTEQELNSSMQEISQEIKIELPYDPAISLLVYISSKKLKS